MQRKLFLFLMVVLLEGVFIPVSFALDEKNEPSPPVYPVLILDFKKNSESLPMHFRIISSPSASPTSALFVREGLKGLQASGSAQFDGEF